MKKHAWLTRAALVATAALFLTAACKKQEAGVKAFPASQEVSGWAKTGETRTFAPDKLSDYIDGDAEKYIQAGVKSTSTADYKYQDKVDAVVDVFTMPSQDAARNVFSSEPAMDAKSVQLGDEARAYSQSVLFRKGPYFVRIVAYQPAPELQQAMTDLGRGIEKKLK
jgi:hypothetical protein